MTYSRHVLVTLVVLTSVGVALLPRPTAVQGRTIVVTNLADDGPGSLRQPLAESSAGDLIEFEVVGTIDLLSTLSIDRSVTVRGTGFPIDGEPLIRLSGGDQVPVLLVEAPDVTIESIAVANGSADDYGVAGGITNRGGLTVKRCLIADNVTTGSGGGVYNTDSLLLSESAVVRNHADNSGGGVYSPGDNAATRIETCRIASNSAGSGGGYYGGGPVSDTVFEDNVASSDGGGLRLTDGLVTRCSTIGNRANRGAGVFVAEESAIVNTTIAENAAQLRTTRYGEYPAEGNHGHYCIIVQVVIGRSRTRMIGAGRRCVALSKPLLGMANE